MRSCGSLIVLHSREQDAVMDITRELHDFRHAPHELVGQTERNGDRPSVAGAAREA